MLLMHSKKRKIKKLKICRFILHRPNQASHTIESAVCPKEWIDFFYNRAAVMAAFNTKIIGFAGHNSVRSALERKLVKIT